MRWQQREESGINLNPKRVDSGEVLNKPTAMTGMMVHSLIIERLMTDPLHLNVRWIFRGLSPSRDSVFRELIDG